MLRLPKIATIAAIRKPVSSNVSVIWKNCKTEKIIENRRTAANKVKKRNSKSLVLRKRFTLIRHLFPDIKAMSHINLTAFERIMISPLFILSQAYNAQLLPVVTIVSHLLIVSSDSA